jgi:TrmH family RNA methyltransferase
LHEGSFVTSSPFSGKTLFLVQVNDVILSTGNPKVKELVKLRQSSRRRRELGLFVVEGAIEISVLLKAGKKICEIYYCEDLPRHGETWEFLESCQEDGCELREMGTDAFGKASYKSGSRAPLAVFETWDLSISRLQQSPRVALVLDEVEKPGNLGAILRTAEAFGVSSVLLSDPALDFFNPNVVRSSRGLMAGLDIASGSKEEVFSWLTKEDLRLIGTSAKSSGSYWNLDFVSGTVFVLGSEKAGLGQFWRERIDEWITIPMEGEASSLNLNVSAACLLAEFNRSVHSVLKGS